MVSIRVGVRSLSGRQMEGGWEQLLDFSQPLDVVLLDSAVETFYNAAASEEARALRAAHCSRRCSRGS